MRPTSGGRPQRRKATIHTEKLTTAQASAAFNSPLSRYKEQLINNCWTFGTTNLRKKYNVTVKVVPQKKLK